jgi:hypothetical protein
MIGCGIWFVRTRTITKSNEIFRQQQVREYTNQIEVSGFVKYFA